MTEREYTHLPGGFNVPTISITFFSAQTQYERPRPQAGVMYYFLGPFHEPHLAVWGDSRYMDESLYKARNVFLDEASATLASRKRIAADRLQDIADELNDGPWTPKSAEPRYSLVNSPERRIIIVAMGQGPLHTEGEILFKTELAARAAMHRMGKEDLCDYFGMPRVSPNPYARYAGIGAWSVADAMHQQIRDQLDQVLEQMARKQMEEDVRKEDEKFHRERELLASVFLPRGFFPTIFGGR